MIPRHQVFVSSTHDDLVEERKAVIGELLQLGCIPAAMEFFQPINDNSLEIIKGVLDHCDYLVLIVAGRYGSVVKGKSKKISFTEEEYKYAKSKKIPVLPFLLRDSKLDILKKSKKKTDKGKVETTNTGRIRLTRFRRQLMKEAFIGFFETEGDLPELVANALNTAKARKPRPGWIRANQTFNWNIISSATEKDFRNHRKYEEIIPLFRKGWGLSKRLRLAFPLTKLLLGKSKRELELTLQTASKTVKDNAINSGFYHRNRDTKKIELIPECDDYDRLYAMCHVSENFLHGSNKNKFGNNSFFNNDWWEPPWDNVTLYMSQICSDEAFAHTVKVLLREMQRTRERNRAECLSLIYRLIMSRPAVNTDLLKRVLNEISSFSLDGNKS
jgi:hypothetical protein